MKDPDKALLWRDAEPKEAARIDPALVRTEYEVLHLMRQVALHFGFQRFMIARFPHTDQERFVQQLVLSNWPADLVRAYDAQGVFHISCLVQTLKHTKLPVFSADCVFAAKAGKADGLDVSALFESHDCAGSLGLLLHSTAGEAFLMVFSGRCSPLSDDALPGFHYMAVQLFECLERTFEAGSSAREKLSSRELECLRWAAAGKSSDEIAIILGISVYTVSSYFKSAVRKLDAVNRMQAIARAMRLKLI